jgi:signal transduction histidine kinase
MNELIDKLLFLARHENNTFVFEKEEFSLTEMLQEMDKETHIIDTMHEINFELKKEVSIYADRNLLKQAVRIFIDNAIKYTLRGGKISVRLDRIDRTTEISITDEGIGMTKDELKHIFDRFYRSDQSRTREKGGHGLGLAIAKTIIIGHQGRIKVRSKLGNGSEFIILFEDQDSSLQKLL